MKRLLSLTLALLLILPCFLLPINGHKEESFTILFTHDLHSHFLPTATDDGGESGGYARLYTALEEERKRADGAVITLDGGDFSMGSLFQTIYASDAAELRILGHLGYDATTLGNHEFDFRQSGLVSMLNAAVDSGDPLVPIVQANYAPPEDASDAIDAFERYGIKDYIIVEKSGIRFAVFGLIGEDAHSNAPMSGMVFEDPIERAREIVSHIEENEDFDYIVCLSHSGFEPEKDGTVTEDRDLAKKVAGIDVIVSGHTHSTFEEPIKVKDTWIVSSGSYAKNLGVLTLKGSHKNTELVSYRLRVIDETLADAPKIEEQIGKYRDLVTENYLSDFGLTFDSVLATSPFPFDRTGGSEQADRALGNLISDAYRYAVEQVEGEGGEEITFAVNAAGVIRDTLPQGEITTSDVFGVLSLGVGADGTAGYPLVSAYVTGRELKDAMEVDASVVPLMNAAQLYGNGLYWKYNTNRMIFNKVVESGVVGEDGSIIPLEDDKLYRIVTGLYCCQMLSTVEGKSFGILSITPRNADGSPVTDYDSLILHDKNGNELKEWYALASYLQSFEKNEDGIPVVPDRYQEPQNRKVVYSSLSPYELLRNANLITIIVVILILSLTTAAVLTTVFITKRVRRKRREKKGNNAQSVPA